MIRVWHQSKPVYFHVSYVLQQSQWTWMCMYCCFVVLLFFLHWSDQTNLMWESDWIFVPNSLCSLFVLVWTRVNRYQSANVLSLIIGFLSSRCAKILCLPCCVAGVQQAVLPDRVDDFQPKSSPKPAHFNNNQPKICIYCHVNQGW